MTLIEALAEAKRIGLETPLDIDDNGGGEYALRKIAMHSELYDALKDVPGLGPLLRRAKRAIAISN